MLLAGLGMSLGWNRDEWPQSPDDFNDRAPTEAQWAQIEQAQIAGNVAADSQDLPRSSGWYAIRGLGSGRGEGIDG